MVSIVGTNDLHGHIDRLPLIAGYVENLRRAREDRVLLIDAGDMFQGTLESNLGEGAATIRAMNAARYTASTIGNHEFDYGPVGPPATPQAETDDPRGALIARLGEASFPILSANIVDRATNERPAWARPTHRVEIEGAVIGLIGLTTESTPRTTIAANVSDLAIASLAETAARHARELRESGADAVIVTAHAGGKCRSFDDPRDVESCDPSEEIFEVARALPAGLVDVIVAGHTHQGVAHVVNGIAIIESFSYGTAFGRVDLTIDREANRVVDTRVFRPQDVCRDREAEASTCVTFEYEGAAVTPVRAVAEAIASDLERAHTIRAEPLGVTLAGELDSSRSDETALGNLLADLIRTARSGDVGVMNGGGIRAPLPAGPLVYGSFYETFPFDNRFAIVTLTVAELRDYLASSVASDAGRLSISGVTALARCDGSRVTVTLSRANRRLRDADRLRVVMSDYLATVDGAVLNRARDEGRVEIESGDPMREALVGLLRERGGTIDPRDRALLDPTRPRLDTGDYPLRCR